MELHYRPATETDLPTLVALLADDPLGARRERPEHPLPPAYIDALVAITADLNQELTVVEQNGELVAMFQLTFTQYLTYQGGIRAQIEGVRVGAAHRSQGIGKAIFEYAIDRARTRGAHLLQLTTDKQRPDALRFYESLGFVASHEGMKRHLSV